MRILAIDDDEIALLMLTATLEQGGHEVLTAGDGVEALERLEGGDIQMVVSDWMMPRMDGAELCRQIRERSPSRYVYVILVTALSSAREKVAGLEAGADDFITKPYDPLELQLRVRAAERVLAIETRHMTIFAMAKLAESRDPETGLHLERVRSYARLVGRWLLTQEDLAAQAPREFPELIYQTIPLHDIGKVGIPDYVLLKPARLTDAEFAVMKSHSVIGGDTLAAALRQYPGAGFLVMARDIARCHHERFDGGGYPDGLRGEEIPLSARVAALADVYDALTVKRVYKSAFSHEVARGIILGEAGKQFDPRVIDAFLACENDFIETRRALRDPWEDDL